MTQKKRKTNWWFIVPLAIFLFLVFILLKDIIEIYPTLESGDSEMIKSALSSLGLKGAIIMGFIQAIQMLLVFLPSELIQIIAGATYGIWQGALIVMAGFFIGATIIYLFVNICNIKIESMFGKSKSYRLINKLNNNKRSVSKLLLLLFFLPAVPIGLICYFGASTKISYRRYIGVSIVGMIPSVVIDCCLGGAIVISLGESIWWLLIAVVAFAILALVLLKLYTNRKINKELYGTAKPTRQMEIDAMYPNKSNPALHALMKIATKAFFVKKNNAKIDATQIKDVKAPFVILATHPSFCDFAYIYNATNEQISAVINKYYFYHKKLYPIMKNSSCIPKMLFNNDISTIKNCIKVIKDNRILMLMPEGRLSIDGSNQPFPPGIDKLVKKLNVPVIAATSTGAYLTAAKWMKYKRKGQVNVKLTQILSQEEVAMKSTEEIGKIINGALTYDDFEYQKTAQIEYKGKNLLAGVDGLLYHCPKCHREFTIEGDKNTIECLSCGQKVHMDNKYNFIDSPYDGIENIQDWYRYQAEYEKKVLCDENFEISTPVVLKTYEKFGKGLIVVGNGILKLTKTDLIYEGTKCGEFHHAQISLKQLHALAFSCNQDVECYIDNEFYWFEPTENKRICTKLSLYVDLINGHDDLSEN